MRGAGCGGAGCGIRRRTKSAAKRDGTFGRAGLSSFRPDRKRNLEPSGRPVDLFFGPQPGVQQSYLLHPKAMVKGPVGVDLHWRCNCEITVISNISNFKTRRVRGLPSRLRLRTTEIVSDLVRNSIVPWEHNDSTSEIESDKAIRGLDKVFTMSCHRHRIPT